LADVSKRRGRPVNPDTRTAILNAAASLIQERGYDQASVDAIAHRAHAGKQTIYRLWGSKARLVADLVRTRTLPFPNVSVPDTGDLRADLVSWQAESLPLITESTMGSVIRALIIDQATIDTTESIKVSLDLPASRADRLRVRLEKARERGEIRQDADLGAAVDLIVGAHVRGLLHLTSLTEDRAEAWADLLVAALRPWP
jgi:AcrR family transcriptional regulator